MKSLFTEDLNAKRKVVVIGTIFLDIKGYPEGTFVPDGRNAGRIEYRAGGVARNVAMNMAALGFEPVFLSISDRSQNAAAIEKELESAGVRLDHLIRNDQGIGVWMAIFDNEGNVHSNISRRQDLSELTELLRVRGEEIFEGAAGILLEMDACEELVSEAMALSKRMEIPVFGLISNMVIGKERAKFIEKNDCFVCNGLEAGQLFDVDTEGLSASAMLDILKCEAETRKMKAMVVTLDKQGAVFTSSDGCSGLCPTNEVTPVDSAGAGDAFFSGVAAGLLTGKTLEKACKIGTEIASEVLMTRENVIRKRDR